MHALCGYCKTPFSPPDARMRFCSEECRTRFSVKHHLDSATGNVLLHELEQLHESLKAAAHTEELSQETRLSLYESVVERTALVLKWLNTQAFVQEHPTTSPEFVRLEEAHQKTLHQLEKTLRHLLELKQKNEVLRKQLRKHMAATGAEKLALTLLGLEAPYTAEQLKSAYREKVKKAHPDVDKGDADVFKGLHLAMSMLKKGKS